ncbi:STN domain-containing protein [Pseudothauera rhizosphaerae]|uniref:Energy transducer TonB n=1 Tax=Pseudothauera rhizosphaerae TaxID=2565932 RepID=A0A4S4APT1_9RHOO|nr:STN domain-containing protein [Pseudothauera rhizosphaerae]THF60443.1 energy transducer TonB [Pseudothauera rhizosphaerae]
MGFVLACACTGFLHAGVGVSPPPPAAGVSADAAIDFDIPAQALETALERYGAVTGRSVIHQGSLSMGRTSSPVKGRFTPDAGLRLLLEGTGLSPRYSDPERIVLLPAPRTPSDNAAAAAVHRAYFGAAQASLRRAFCNNPWIAPGGYRAAISLRLDARGAVLDARLLDTTADTARDAAIVETLLAMRFQAPPADVPQPMLLLILPRAASANECPADSADPTEN